jgi:Cdc6-like AAA superfamily ATPase
VDAFDLLMAKARQRRPDRGIVLHGLRGVGKTVLLNEFRRQAEHAEFMVVTLEGRDADGGPDAVRAKLARNLLQAGRKLNARTAGATLKSALGSVASFSAKLGFPVSTSASHSTAAARTRGPSRLTLKSWSRIFAPHWQRKIGTRLRDRRDAGP